LSSNAIIDSDGNIYVTGRTLEQNISTPGVFQENFDIIYSQGNILENNYLAKLNPNGELIWTTYLPAANIKDHGKFIIKQRKFSVQKSSKTSKRFKRFLR
jgi:outer membrane protein assembly factor BamB